MEFCNTWRKYNAAKKWECWTQPSRNEWDIYFNLARWHDEITCTELPAAVFMLATLSWRSPAALFTDNTVK